MFILQGLFWYLFKIFKWIKFNSNHYDALWLNHVRKFKFDFKFDIIKSKK